MAKPAKNQPAANPAANTPANANAPVNATPAQAPANVPAENSAPANVPANPQVPAKADAKKLTFAELIAMPIGDLATHLKKIVSVNAAVEKAKDAFSASLQFSAKCVAALKRAYVDRLNKKEIPPDTTFKKYFEQNASGTLPGRVEALASLFNALVLTVDVNGKPLLSEEFFDAAAVDWLEKANAIIKSAQKTHGDAWKTCDDVLDTINALSKPGDALKKIKEIRERQKGKKGEGDETVDATSVAPLTNGRAIQFLIAAVKNAKALSEKDAYELYCGTFLIMDTWADSGLSDETLNAWMSKYDKARKHGVNPTIEVVTPETQPAETPATETPAPALAVAA
ncbi:MAG: hypothetical protein C5B50_00960 [Verrucomicrobia bacterium]|nr:MAG: hypothetical protein C5B50_00960 [Verrucomicrobiota bacterium]